MGFHDRNNCQCPSCLNFRNMIDQLQVSDLKMATSNPAPGPFASIAMQLASPATRGTSDAIHASVPVPQPSLQDIRDVRYRATTAVDPRMEDISVNLQGLRIALQRAAQARPDLKFSEAFSLIDRLEDMFG